MYDHDYQNVDVEYLSLVHKIFKYGTVKKDRTGTGTISLFGPQMEFDLQEGFPLLSTKKLPFRVIAEELFWFLSGSTNLKDLLDRKVNIWNADAYRWYKHKFPESDMSFEQFISWVKESNDGFDLGPIYPAQWKHIEQPNKVVKVNKRIVPRDDVIIYPLQAIEEPQKDEKDALIGRIFRSNNFGDFKVLKRSGSDNQHRKVYTIQFLYTGYKTTANSKAIKNGSVRDLWYPSVFGKGYLGVIPKGEVELSLKRTWENMMSRCYNPKDRLYHLYGGAGVFVSKRWLSFKNFLHDAKLLPNWHKKIKDMKNFNLDKDYYNSNAYSVNTCVWLSREENSLYRKGYFKPLKVTYPDGKCEVFLSRSKLEKSLHISSAELTSKLEGRKTRKEYNFTVEKVDNPELYRYALPINQIQDVVTLIKETPDSRRLVVSSWNPTVLDSIVLPACHTLFQFYVSDGKLSCKMYQRSADVFLGLPFNIASYALLTHIIAKMTGLEVGRLIITIGDAHIYLNHVDQLKLQMTREPRQMPILKVINKRDKLEDYVFSDLELTGYDPHGVIKGKVSVGK